MSYQIIPNIIFILAVLGIVLIILRHLPEATVEQKKEDSAPVVEKLSKKGLPALAVSGLRSKIKLWSQKLWHFMLEAKDLKPTAVAGYKIKKIFGKQAAGVQKASKPAPVLSTVEVKDEQFFLDQIKNDPKNLQLYGDLGKYYIDRGNFEDAKDIYLYLTKHDLTNSDYYAHLAQVYFKLKDFQAALQNYDKSLTLDSTQPHRFYNKGVCLEALGKLQAAGEAFRSAIELESQNPRFFVSLANVEIRLGNRNAAKVALRGAKKLDPFNQEIAEKLKTL